MSAVLIVNDRYSIPPDLCDGLKAFLKTKGINARIDFLKHFNTKNDAIIFSDIIIFPSNCFLLMAQAIKNYFPEKRVVVFSLIGSNKKIRVTKGLIFIEKDGIKSLEVLASVVKKLQRLEENKESIRLRRL